MFCSLWIFGTIACEYFAFSLILIFRFIFLVNIVCSLPCESCVFCFLCILCVLFLANMLHIFLLIISCSAFWTACVMFLRILCRFLEKILRYLPCEHFVFFFRPILSALFLANIMLSVSCEYYVFCFLRILCSVSCEFGVSCSGKIMCIFSDEYCVFCFLRVCVF